MDQKKKKKSFTAGHLSATNMEKKKKKKCGNVHRLFPKHTDKKKRKKCIIISSILCLIFVVLATVGAVLLYYFLRSKSILQKYFTVSPVI